MLSQNRRESGLAVVFERETACLRRTGTPSRGLEIIKV
jgi:hypothetical protein